MLCGSAVALRNRSRAIGRSSPVRCAIDSIHLWRSRRYHPTLLIADPAGEPSSAVRARVIGAREIQRLRYESDGIRTNSDLTPSLLPRFCALDRPAMRVLNAAVARLSLSARAYDRVRKVARTISCLEGAETIGADHLGEALQFRQF